MLIYPNGAHMKLSDSGKLREILKKYNPDLKDTEESFIETYEKVMKGFPDVLRKKIRDARVAKNIGQVELSKLLNTTQSTYSSWERGAHIPKIENIIQLAEILNVDPSEFIELNPMGEHDRRELPILDKSWFSERNLDDFLSLIHSPKKFGVRSFRLVHTEAQEEFAFDVGFNTDMKNNEDGIRPHSLVTVTSTPLKGKTKEEILKIANGHVCVVSINNGPGLLREVYFDGSIVRFKAWNKDVESRVFPVLPNSLASVVNFAGELIFNKDSVVLSLDNIEIFGIALECIQDLHFMNH